jgi:hypothetical protein
LGVLRRLVLPKAQEPSPPIFVGDGALGRHG